MLLSRLWSILDRMAGWSDPRFLDAPIEDASHAASFAEASFAGAPFAAVVLAGGPGTRMGHPAKATLTVGGVAMLARVLAATDDAAPRVVVGVPDGADLPPDVLTTVEDPPGGGPVAATAAGLALLRDLGGGVPVAVLAADLPFLTAAVLHSLRTAVNDGYDGAVLLDDAAHPQWLCGVWRLGALRSRLDAIGAPVGAAVRHLVAGLTVARLGPTVHEPPTWFDCDTRDDLRRAEEWVHGDAG
jgi:molybdenum cofactor guanylyltransferase